MHQKGNFVIALVVVIAAIALGYWLLNKKAEAPTKETATDTVNTEPIKIGWMGPLTGDAASYGESIKKGVELAVKDANLSNVVVVYEDSKCDGKEAVNAVNKLINIDKVAAIVGEVCSGATLAVAPVAEQNKVVMISPASTAPKVTDAGAYVFRTIPSDALQGEFGAKLVHDQGFKKIAILYSNEEYGIGFQKVLNENFTKLGGTVVASESFEKNATDVRTQLAKIKAKNPNAVYIISNAPSASVSALKQIKQLGIKAAVFGSEGLKSPDIVKGAGNAAEGLIVTSVTAGTLDFIAKHKTAYAGAEPGPFAAQGYDAFKAIALAIKNGATNSEGIKSHLTADPSAGLPAGSEFANHFDGASGSIKFDQNGDVAGNYEVYKVDKGAFILAQ